VNGGQLKCYILSGRSKESWITTLDSQANLSNRARGSPRKRINLLSLSSRFLVKGKLKSMKGFRLNRQPAR
jgi:hypothetical protein